MMNLPLSCPTTHRINLKRVVSNNGPMFGEYICGTCYKRGRIDWMFPDNGSGDRAEFWERVDGSWSIVSDESDLTWE